MKCFSACMMSLMHIYKRRESYNHSFNCYFFVSWTCCHGNISIAAFINLFVNDIHPKPECKVINCSYFMKQPLMHPECICIRHDDEGLYVKVYISVALTWYTYTTFMVMFYIMHKQCVTDLFSAVGSVSVDVGCFFHLLSL